LYANTIYFNLILDDFYVLSLNPSKTEFLLSGLQQQLAEVNQPVLHLPDNTTVTSVTNARKLGILFDSNLSFEQHINFLTKTCLYHCHDLRIIRFSLDFVTHCSYYCTCSYPLKARLLQLSLLSPFFIINKPSDSKFTRQSRHKDSSFLPYQPGFSVTHWLKIKQRIVTKIVYLIYTALRHNSFIPSKQSRITIQSLYSFSISHHSSPATCQT